MTDTVEQRLARLERTLKAMQWPGLDFELIQVLEKYRRMTDVQSLDDYRKACVAEISALARVVAAVELGEQPAMHRAFVAEHKRWYNDGAPKGYMHLGIQPFVEGYRLADWLANTSP
jgi:hypothetical protein